MSTFLARAMTYVALVTLWLPIAATAAFNKLYVFGDSLSDSGNAYNIVLNDPANVSGEVFPPPPNNQRNSNGLVAVEYLAQNLGLPLQPSYTGGTNYAVSGAMTGERTVGPLTTENFAYAAYQGAFGTSALQFGTSLLSQISQFSLSQPSVDPSSTLFVVWAGANDFFFDPQQSTVSSAVTNIAFAMQNLARLGARRFLLPGLPDLSLTPAIMDADTANPGAGIATGYRALSLGFNEALEKILIPSLEAAGLDITYFDVNAALHRILNDPGAYRITNVNEGCLVLFVSECSNPDEYLFWDSVHPTDRIYRVLGNQFTAAVPEPETLAIATLGLVILTAFRRRSKPQNGCSFRPRYRYLAT
jgi:phospholipase/lecithinase/hemolysin